ncbi:MAG: hypothetical protein EXR33_00335 [Betaproteobacteria bacterium]|nr:hypothetical protein [Betaproteobacteria bacterium]
MIAHRHSASSLNSASEAHILPARFAKAVLLEDEHARYEDAKAAARAGGGGKEAEKGPATYRPLAGLADLVKPKRKP